MLCCFQLPDVTICIIGAPLSMTLTTAGKRSRKRFDDIQQYFPSRRKKPTSTRKPLPLSTITADASILAIQITPTAIENITRDEPIDLKLQDNINPILNSSPIHPENSSLRLSSLGRLLFPILVF